MHAKIFSATTIGIDAHLLEIEADLSMGLINFFIVGLPDKAVRESKDRIKAAFKNSGIRLPNKSITVNLAPAHLKKEGASFDLPIALAILQASGLISLTPAFVSETLFLGELSLDGSLRSVRGTISIAHYALSIGKRRIVIPSINAYEASLIKGIDIIPVNNLVELISYLRNEKIISPFCSSMSFSKEEKKTLDFNQVKGQGQAKRALQIAGAGNHNILFIGPPGSGKTMLAQRLITLLPPLTIDEVMETTKIYSVAGYLKENSIVTERPFRAPHHTISQAGLIGGGSTPQPGEITLAHNGVLFLDELTEFKRSTLEALRQPLEQKKVLISRALAVTEFPSNFLLVVALNPCPCGFYGDKKKQCDCSSQAISRYMSKLSGPLLDRIDLHVHVSSIDFQELEQKQTDQVNSSEGLLKKINAALDFKKASRNQCTANATLSSEEVEKKCLLTTDAHEAIKKAFNALNLSMRSYHKILKIARTIADLDQSLKIEKMHIQEALTYRFLDRSA